MNCNSLTRSKPSFVGQPKIEAVLFVFSRAIYGVSKGVLRFNGQMMYLVELRKRRERGLQTPWGVASGYWSFLQGHLGPGWMVSIRIQLASVKANSRGSQFIPSAPNPNSQVFPLSGQFWNKLLHRHRQEKELLSTEFSVELGTLNHHVQAHLWTSRPWPPYLTLDWPFRWLGLSQVT